jgi:hypothetical protein
MMRGRGEARSSMKAQTKQPNECCFCQRRSFEINNGIIITSQVVVLVVTWEPKMVMW